MKLTPKGMRDFLPDEAMVREEVRDKIVNVYKKYGFVPMETPALEYLETLKAKAGEEIDKQLFVLKDERLALRFDLTVPLARIGANIDVPKPFKRYAVGPVWRREEPQKGRFREFWQADADIIGSPSMRSEAELLTMANEICNDFGFKKPKIMLNNRKILDALAEKIGFKKEKDEALRLLDKIDKAGKDAVEDEIIKLLGKRGEELIEIVTAGKDNEEKLSSVEKTAKEGVQQLREILSLCDFDIEVDLSMARGLGYYTGPVFEIKLSDEIGTVIAGGRYDNLLSVYGREDYATGISVGIERLITLSFEKSGKKKTNSSVLVANVKDEFYKDALKLSEKLREAGISCETDINGRNLRKQLDYANAAGIPFIIVVGKKEVETGKYNLKDMKSGEEKTMDIKQIIKKLG